jgi:hypothetical protein
MTPLSSRHRAKDDGAAPSSATTDGMTPSSTDEGTAPSSGFELKTALPSRLMAKDGGTAPPSGSEPATALPFRHRAKNDGAAPSSEKNEGKNPSLHSFCFRGTDLHLFYFRGLNLHSFNFRGQKLHSFYFGVSSSANRPAKFFVTNLSRGIFRLDASSAGRPAEFSARISKSGIFYVEVTRQATTRGFFSQTRLLGEAALGWSTRSRLFAERGTDLLSECDPVGKPHFAERGADQLSECDPAEKSQIILENAKGGTHLFSESVTTGKTQVTTHPRPCRMNTSKSTLSRCLLGSRLGHRYLSGRLGFIRQATPLRS